MSSKRNVARAQARVAQGATRMIRNAPPERLERLMRSPARLVILEAIFWQMPRQLDPKRAAGTTASVRWEITRGAQGPATTYQLELDDGRARVLRGATAGEPRVTITLDGAEFLRIATGATDPTQAYFSGRVAISGDIMVAAKLGSMFVIPGQRS